MLAALLALAVVLAVSMGTVIGAQLAPAERLEAQEFVLVDAQGETRARLSMDPRPTLTFYDDGEELVMVLGMTDDGPVLGAIGPDGEPRNYLGPDPHVNPLR